MVAHAFNHSPQEPEAGDLKACIVRAGLEISSALFYNLRKEYGMREGRRIGRKGRGAIRGEK